MVEEADLVIVMGSSLSIYPFAALPGRAREGAVRVLINNERGVRKLAAKLGWAEELKEVWGSVGGGSDKKAEVEAESSEDAKLVESIDAKVGRLTEEVERSLSVVDGWKDKVMKDTDCQNGRGRPSRRERRKDRTNLDTAARAPEHLVKKAGSVGGE
ncbi:hypothetical protein HOY80DRAFT_1136654 [Tuber brumale]|nr:hypothetical protein HOY80DRAFT_1136654 [Tuber brumale]